MIISQYLEVFYGWICKASGRQENISYGRSGYCGGRWHQLSVEVVMTPTEKLFLPRSILMQRWKTGKMEIMTSTAKRLK